jgi:hypothetical protein
MKLSQALAALPKGTIVVSVKDGQGNLTRIEGKFSVGLVHRELHQSKNSP